MPTQKPAAKKKPASEADQGRRFEEAARELGCDESEERFDAALKVIAKHKPKDEKPKKGKPGR